ncbi:uncharacterized protein BKA55DRAFT_566224 [Fusarium redolens]|uniref:Uncharacterized protein n=1 Tax=Fusarium redolens TaxID=48865 RepID=A0A9P9H9Z7_FUSRE|nr:uncharacterized protein BKA55DRAFT_566224 [Fusarium redolens]KAH7253765.1 hypothetical protein BKA55DRAFT_566224 [Fusarium redolens]
MVAVVGPQYLLLIYFYCPSRLAKCCLSYPEPCKLPCYKPRVSPVILSHSGVQRSRLDLTPAWNSHYLIMFSETLRCRARLLAED